MSHPRRRVAALLIAAVILSGAAPAVAETPIATPLALIGSLEVEHVADELLVGFRESSSPAQLSAALEESDVVVAQDLVTTHTKLVKVADGESLASAMDKLRRQPGVQFVEPNYIYHADAIPNDDNFPNLWGMHNTGQTILGVTGTADADIDAPEAWDLTTGSTNVAVAIVDSGIDYNHPDFAGNIWTNPGETGGGREGNGVDDDHNGFVDDWRGWDFVNNDNDPRDQNLAVGHGSHVAGTIGARGNNTGAVTGVNWRVGLIGLRVFDATGSSTTVQVTNAFNYAGDMGIRVVNYSGGGSGSSAAMQQAIDNHPNTLYVVAAGNSAANLDGTGATYPCEYPSSNLICVAASGQSDQLASYSNYGASSVDIAAPGTGIWSLAPSMSLPFAETFFTEPFATRWVKGANAGVNTWTWESAYSPDGPGQEPGLTDGSSYTADYPTNSYTWVQTAAPINLAAETGCSLLFPMYVDVNSTGTDRFRVWVGSNTSFTDTNFVQSWSGTGLVDNVIDLNAFSGGPLYLRFGLVTDGVPDPGFDGVYIDTIEVRCVDDSYTTNGTGNGRVLSGTSMASPHVAGAAALVLSRDGSLGTAQLRNIILTTGDPKPAFQGTTVSGRRLNLFNAVSSVAPTDTTAPTITITTPANGATYNVGQAVTANYSCNDTGGSGLVACNGPVANGALIDTATPGTKTFTVNAADGANNTATATRTYTVANVSDTTAPTITITTPANGATYNVGQTVTANYSCNDTGGSGLVACNGPVANGALIDTATPGTKTFTVNAADGANNTATATRTYTVAGTPPDGGSSNFTSLTPTRLLDSRGKSTLPAGASTDVVVAGREGVPLGVSAVLVNLTATNAQADGYLTTWPTGESRPTASSLNFAGGQTVANLVMAKVGTNGSISIWNSNDSADMRSTDIVVDIVGYFPSPASIGALSPERVLDTRSSSKVGAGGTREVPLLGQKGIPTSGVGAVILNLTVTGAEADGYLTTWPTAETRPRASSLNFARGQTVANIVVAKVGANGSISIWNSNDSTDMQPTNVVVDVVGWLPEGAAFGSLTPSRILDTRNAGPLAAGATTEVHVLGRGGVPATGVGAVILNLTVTGTQADGYLTTWPAGLARPDASSLNFARGQTVANIVVAKVGANGSVSVWNSNDSTGMQPTNVIVDVVGWFAQ